MKKKYLISLIISFILFIALTIFIIVNNNLTFEYNIFKFINGNNSLYTFFRIITELGEWYSYVVIVILIFIFKRKYSYVLTASILASTLLNNALKLLFMRERPTWKLYSPHGYSYPSGHAMSSLAFYGLIIYLIIKYYKGKGKKIIIGLISLLIFIIGISRIYLGVHYFTDVIGAYLFDIGYLIIFITLIENKQLIKE